MPLPARDKQESASFFFLVAKIPQPVWHGRWNVMGV